MKLRKWDIGHRRMALWVAKVVIWSLVEFEPTHVVQKSLVGCNLRRPMVVFHDKLAPIKTDIMVKCKVFQINTKTLYLHHQYS